MFKFQFIRKFGSELTVLLVTATTLVQSDTASSLLAAIQAMVLRQPQGF